MTPHPSASADTFSRKGRRITLIDHEFRRPRPGHPRRPPGGHRLQRRWGWSPFPLGAALGWRWVRIRWWRALHMASWAVVAVQAALGRACFLTLWQDAADGRRRPAAAASSAGSKRVIYWPLPIWRSADLSRPVRRAIALWPSAAAETELAPSPPPRRHRRRRSAVQPARPSAAIRRRRRRRAGARRPTSRAPPPASRRRLAPTPRSPSSSAAQTNTWAHAQAQADNLKQWWGLQMSGVRPGAQRSATPPAPRKGQRPGRLQRLLDRPRHAVVRIGGEPRTSILTSPANGRLPAPPPRKAAARPAPMRGVMAGTTSTIRRTARWASAASWASAPPPARRCCRALQQQLPDRADRGRGRHRGRDGPRRAPHPAAAASIRRPT